MYRQHFGMTHEPFGPELPTAKLYAWKATTEVRARLAYLFGVGGVGLLTGDVGAAKTTSVRAAVSELHPDRFRVVYLAQSSASVLDFLRALA